MLQDVAALCRVLQCVATRISTAKSVRCNNKASALDLSRLRSRVLQDVAVCCSVLQCDTVYCSVLHHSPVLREM